MEKIAKNKIISTSIFVVAFSFMLAMSYICINNVDIVSAETHSLIISEDDFEVQGGITFSSSNQSAGAVWYDLDKEIQLKDKTGIAIRTKNISGGQYSINQFRFYTSDIATNYGLVYSTYNSTIKFYWKGGRITTTHHNARYVNIPADFDGYMLIDFSEMNHLRETDKWIWNLNTHLLADGQGAYKFPVESWKSFAYYSLANTVGKEIMFGQMAAYVTDGNTMQLDEGTTANLQTARRPGSEPLMNVFKIPGAINLTYTVDGKQYDANTSNLILNVDKEKYNLHYGDSVDFVVDSKKGFTLDKIEISDGENSFILNSDKIVHKFKKGGNYNVNFNSCVKYTNDFTDGKGTIFYQTSQNNQNVGLTFTLKESLSMLEKDGIAIRIKNLSIKDYQLKQFFVRIKGIDLVYSPHQFSFYLMNKDGDLKEISSEERKSQVSNNERTVAIPSNFDGYILLPFNQMTVTHHTGADKDDYSETAKIGSATEGDFAPAFGLWEKLSLWLPQKNMMNEEFVFGEFATFNITDGVPILQEKTTAEKTNQSGTVEVKEYPETACFIKYKINGKDYMENSEISIGDATKVSQFMYGDSITLNPVCKLGYALTKILLSVGDNTIELKSYTIVNLSKESVEYVVDCIIEETIPFTAIDGDNLEDKLFLKAKVNNTSDREINYSITIMNDQRQYTASKGAGIFTAGGVSWYDDVFKIPAGFNGEIYIPFNVYRGDKYGGVQNTPWNYVSVEDKPSSVSNKVYMSFSSNHTKSELMSAFFDFAYISEDKQITGPVVDNANLHQDGRTDFIGGVLIDPTKVLAADQAGSGKAFFLKFSDPVSFDNAGIAIRVNNISGNDFGVRVYFDTVSKKVYVPQLNLKYYLIDQNGVVKGKIDKNRNVIIPMNFNGTVVVDFSGYATDNGSKLVENIDRTEEMVNSIRFYSAGNSSSGCIFSQASFINYNGMHSEVFKFSDETHTVENDKVSQTALNIIPVEFVDININNENVSLSVNEILFGEHELIITPKINYIITDIKVPEHCKIEKSDNGSYIVIIDNNYTYNIKSVDIEIVTDEAVTIGFNVKGHGQVTDVNGVLIEDELRVVKGVKNIIIIVVPEKGYCENVAVDGKKLSAIDVNKYEIPFNTEKVEVVFVGKETNLKTDISTNGKVEVDGIVLSSGDIQVKQAIEHTIKIVPNKGYKGVVMLNNEFIEATNDNEYVVKFYDDAELKINFELVVYIIEYDLDLGKNSAENPNSYTIEDEIILRNAHKEGYIFKYWYVLKDGKEEQIENIMTGNTGNIKIYAKFELALQTGESSEQSGGCASAISDYGTLLSIMVLCVAVISMKRIIKC